MPHRMIRCSVALFEISELPSAFFFQAEDGIRADLVTGVQTCALPIWAPRRPVRLLLHSQCRSASRERAKRGRPRSEERRVGKECRSRWRPYHLKKKSRE